MINSKFFLKKLLIFHRLNITPMPTPSSTLTGGRTTPSRHTPIRGGKRKRTLLEESEERSSSDYSVSGTARGDMEITEADPQGRYVKLTNKGAKVILFFRENQKYVQCLEKVERNF